MMTAALSSFATSTKVNVSRQHFVSFEMPPAPMLRPAVMVMF